MADVNSITTTTFAARVRAIYENAMARNCHEALRCLVGIGDAVHPFFSDLDKENKDNLLVGIIPLANQIQKDLEEVFTEVESLVVEMEKMEVSHG